LARAALLAAVQASGVRLSTAARALVDDDDDGCNVESMRSSRYAKALVQ
jgi:hypothetical protein